MAAAYPDVAILVEECSPQYTQAIIVVVEFVFILSFVHFFRQLELGKMIKVRKTDNPEKKKQLALPAKSEDTDESENS